MSGTCDTGFVFYSCGNGFRGCCSEPACNLGGCPDDATQPDDDTPRTTTVKTDQVTTSQSSTTKPGSVRSGSWSTIASTAEPTAGDAGTTTQTATPSLPLLPSSTGPAASTSTSRSGGGGGSSGSLPTAAIAGICVGATVLAMFVLLIVSLRIRRHRIAKRHASTASSSIRYVDVAYAEDFMKDHPSLTGSVVHGRAELG
ncbi:hypothetical protein GGR52DRAFT_464352 [Hypoxylon sp. FL1284]|nr:hypothetical protein GGR52DRAFT_464352 [Hypoxylon sp. FL1284]